jgi:hypothetical protein
MDDVVCTDCLVLQQRALDATLRHLDSRRQLSLAKQNQDSQVIRVWELVVKHLYQARSAAGRAYQEHLNTHAQEAASARRA